MSKKGVRKRWVVLAGWFLAISYAIGAPVTAILEYRSQVISGRFDIPGLLVYLTSALQFGCALAVLVEPLAPLAAAALTATTLGAILVHLRIGSPLTAWAAVLYTVVQVWFGLAHRAGRMRRN